MLTCVMSNITCCNIAVMQAIEQNYCLYVLSRNSIIQYLFLVFHEAEYIEPKVGNSNCLHKLMTYDGCRIGVMSPDDVFIPSVF